MAGHDAGLSALHVAAAAAALAASLVTLAVSFRGEPLPLGPWRDYVTLTKPRIMSLLLVTGAGGMFVGARAAGLAPFARGDAVGLALACGGASALNHVLDARHRPADGLAHSARPVASGRVPAPRALEFGLVLSALSFALLATTVNVLTAVLALVGNLFYVVVYTRLPQAGDRPEHRHRRGSRSGAAARRLRRRDRQPGAARALALPDRLPLDAAALLGAGADDPRPLRGGQRADAARSSRGERETTRQIVLYSVALVALTVAVGLWLGPVYTVAAAIARRRLPRSRAPAAPRRAASATRSSCSTTRSPTSPCSSWRPRSTRW